mmetsp:Transcript_146404/g.407861  ORF Transcript_146404/g.407861 Transcript_146404/m.407861 type:complete len:221 (+) Transcript_146404:347-1009(+)
MHAFSSTVAPSSSWASGPTPALRSLVSSCTSPVAAAECAIRTAAASRACGSTSTGSARWLAWSKRSPELGCSRSRRVKSSTCCVAAAAAAPAAAATPGPDTCAADDGEVAGGGTAAASAASAAAAAAAGGELAAGSVTSSSPLFLTKRAEQRSTSAWPAPTGHAMVTGSWPGKLARNSQSPTSRVTSAAEVKPGGAAKVSTQLPSACCLKAGANSGTCPL